MSTTLKRLGCLVALVCTLLLIGLPAMASTPDPMAPINGIGLVATLQAQNLPGSMQSVYYNVLNGDYYAAGMNYDPDPVAPDVWVARFGPAGRVMKVLTLANCGHGSIGFIQTPGGYMNLIVSWNNVSGSESLVLVNFNKNSGTIQRSAGTPIPNFQNKDHLKVGGGTGQTVTVRVGDNYGWYTLRQLRLGLPPLRSLTVTDNLGVKQGSAANPAFLYIYTGSYDTPTMIYAYSWQTGQQVAAVNLIDSPYNMGKDDTGAWIGGLDKYEAEGFSIFADADHHSHIVAGIRMGYVHDTSTDQSLVYSSGILPLSS